MSSLSPRDHREWMRNIERLAKRGSTAAAMLIEKSPGGTVDGINEVIEANKRLTPTAPVELLVQTAIYMDEKFVQGGRATVSFPPVTKAVTGQDILIDKYELWGQDLTASALTDTTAPYPGITAPGLSFPGQGFHVNPTVEPGWKLLDSSPEPDLSARSLAVGSRWMLRVRAIGKFTVAPGLWSEEREIQVTPDETPPPQPTKPEITSTLGTIAVRWDGMSVSGPMPSDFLTLHVAMGEAPSPEFIVTNFDNSVKLYVIPDAPYYQPQFFRFRAEDISGNLSPWSEQEVGVALPLVDTSQMEETLRLARAELDAAMNELEGSISAKNGTTDSVDDASDGAGHVIGDRWQKWSSLDPGGKLLATWRYSGTEWIEEELDPTYIPVIDLDTGTEGEITGDRLTDNSVTSGKVADNAITAEKILANAVIAGKIATNAVTAGTIVAGAVTTDKLDALAVTADKIAADTITANKLNVGSVTAAILTADVITSTLLKSDAITVKHTITAAKYQTTTANNRGLQIDATGLKAWTSTGQQTVDIDAATGFATISGRLRSAMPGQPGVVIVPSSESDDGTTMGVWFTPNVDSIPGQVTGGIWTAKLPNQMITTYPLHMRGAYGGGVKVWNNLEIQGVGSLPAQVVGANGLTLQTTGTQAVDVVNRGYDYTMMHKAFGGAGCYNGYYLNGNHLALIGAGGRFGNNAGIEALDRGVRLVTGAGYNISAPAMYSRTSGNAANIFVGSDGALWRSTSALKYKAMVAEMELPKTLLDVKVKDWRDKLSAERYADSIASRTIGCLTESESAEFDAIDIARIPGAIAEEVLAAGGDSFVQYGPDGEVEGLMYDRFTLARTQLLNDKLNKAIERIEELEARLNNAGDIA